MRARAAALVAAALLTSSCAGSAPASSPWKTVLHEDFDDAVATGDFPAGYAGNFQVYPDGWRDTSGKGVYRPSEVLSVHDGVLDFAVGSSASENRGAAVVAALPDYGQLYGRYSIRLRADAVPGMGLAALLWPDSEQWPDDGEIDFPEGTLGATWTATAHHADPAGSKEQFGTAASTGDWHTATIEWAPGSVRFLLDGAQVGESTSGVPTRSMHYIVQVGTDGSGSTVVGSAGHVEVDWIDIASCASRCSE